MGEHPRSYADVKRNCVVKAGKQVLCVEIGWVRNDPPLTLIRLYVPKSYFTAQKPFSADTLKANHFFVVGLPVHVFRTRRSSCLGCPKMKSGISVRFSGGGMRQASATLQPFFGFSSFPFPILCAAKAAEQSECYRNGFTISAPAMLLLASSSSALAAA